MNISTIHILGKQAVATLTDTSGRYLGKLIAEDPRLVQSLKESNPTEHELIFQKKEPYKVLR